jgi:agmatinase
MYFRGAKLKLKMNENDFDPSGYAVHNANFIGLPFDAESANIILLPVPWEATVSYHAGTARAANNILEASYQLDLVDWDYPDAWKFGIYMEPLDENILKQSDKARELAAKHIDNIEHDLPINTTYLDAVNTASNQINSLVYEQTKILLQKNKLVGIVGGEHSCPFGYLQALGEVHEDFGILQIDAHCDLRKAYEGFEYSHASIFYNVMEQNKSVSKLIQVGIRDVCEEELNYVQASNDRIELYPMPYVRRLLYGEGNSFAQFCQEIVEKLPQKVYISFDIDGLDPKLCPHTGTPVPDGFEVNETFYLIHEIVKSGRQIIGFDLCEVGIASEWDGNVGARVLYKLANACYASQKR